MKENYTRIDISLTIISLLATLVIFGFYLLKVIPSLIEFISKNHLAEAFFTIILILIILGFVYGSIVYQLTRIGYVKRLLNFKPQKINKKLPPLTILVPTYKEEIRVIEQTLLSLALLDYPQKKLVLLIDNPPNPESTADRLLLDDTYSLVKRTNKTFKYYRKLIANSIALINESEDISAVKKKLLEDISKIESFFFNIKQNFTDDHVDEFFRENILNEYIKEIENIKVAIIDSDDFEFIKPKVLILKNFFATEITDFERKKYSNLSHESNKAMNLNSYIGLIGGSYDVLNSKDGQILVPSVSNPNPDLTVSDSEYLMTVDADSLVKKDYAKILVSKLESEKNIAVAQTPYCSYKNTPKILERIAGATTDIQYNIHQGFNYFNSAFWVGANAVIRKSALGDIETIETLSNGYNAKRYIQDRTVIEDTESSIDLRVLGWNIYNYPQKLAFSATPSDFGALVIQRRRWANGGMIIFPKLLKYFLKNIYKPTVISEFFIRSHYLLSIFIVNYGFVLLISLPFDKSLSSYLLPLLAVPYLLVYAIDLQKTGYKWYEMVKVYSFNLILVPVNLTGVNKSIEQALVNKKIAFIRTPKIGLRTPTPIDVLLLEYCLLFLLVFSIFLNAFNENYFILIFSGLNLIAFAYGLYLIRFDITFESLRNQLKFYFMRASN